MDNNEALELKELAERGASESAMLPVAFTMCVVAMLVAITTILDHGAHTQAIIFQDQATDTWNEYQAHKIRSYNTSLAEDILQVTTVSDKAAAAKITKGYADHEKKWEVEDKQEQDQAEALQAKVEQAEARGARFDLAEALLEIGLVITSVTLLTRSRLYWYLGLVFSVIGVAAAASAFLLK
jgi:hypothetical protein